MLLSLISLGLTLGAPAAAAPSAPLNLTGFVAQDDAVAKLIAGGKEALAKGDAAAALAKFEEAHEASGESVDTEIFVERARMATGSLDEAFDRILELESEVTNPADASYAIGAGRYLFAKREETKAGGSPGGAFDEARGYLEDAVKANADGYPDAWRMLAESARWTGKPDVASTAIDRALEYSKDAGTLALASKIRIAKGAGLVGAEDTKAAGMRMIEQGVKDATAARAAMPDKKDNAAALADVEMQRGLGLLYLDKKDDAAKAYAEAMGWDPTQVDYGSILGPLTDADGTYAPFVSALETGGNKFEKRWGKDIASDAGLRWWLGYAQHFLGRFDESIESMQLCLAKFPAYSNANWYIGYSHYKLGEENYPAAAEAWKQYSLADAGGMSAFLNGDGTTKVVVGRTIGKLYAGGNGGANVELAADLAEILLKCDETSAQSWNNVGLMHRDAGASVAQLGDKIKASMTPMEHYERSWEAYSQSVELDRKSYYLNDAAVILHYYLERDYDKAIAMYDEAEAMAQKRLDAGGLSKDEKPLVEIALRDSKNNRERLKRKIEKAKKDKEGVGAGGH